MALDKAALRARLEAQGMRPADGDIELNAEDAPCYYHIETAAPSIDADSSPPQALQSYRITIILLVGENLSDAHERAIEMNAKVFEVLRLPEFSLQVTATTQTAWENWDPRWGALAYEYLADDLNGYIKATLAE
ncbi:MAG: hypothetical protein OXE52_13760 [Chloroflexi bacterium]|nr:hypothetical protein [Chloroflexota bacterium]